MHAALFARLDHVLDNVQADQVAHDALVRVPHHFLAPIVLDHLAPSGASGHFIVDASNDNKDDRSKQQRRDRNIRERRNSHDVCWRGL